MTSMFPCFFIVGTTAVGKTDLAFYLAQQKWPENLSPRQPCMVNADSIQIYKDLDIGSSKPVFTDHPQVDCFLFNAASAPQVWTAADFRAQSLKVLNEQLKTRAALLVGGSGFYLQALEKGMYPIQPTSQKTQQKIEQLEAQMGLEFLYKELQKKDPEIAKTISPKDRYRIIRSLCIIETEGQKISDIQKNFKVQKPPWPYHKIGLKRSKADLLKRVKLRTQHMIKKGLIEEVEGLLHKGLQDWKPLKSVGYKEVLLYLQNSINKEEMQEAIIKNTMLLAKKQKTWFQRDQDIQWYDSEEDFAKIKDHFFQLFSKP